MSPWLLGWRWLTRMTKLWNFWTRRAHFLSPLILEEGKQVYRGWVTHSRSHSQLTVQVGLPTPQVVPSSIHWTMSVNQSPVLNEVLPARSFPFFPIVRTPCSLFRLCDLASYFFWSAWDKDHPIRVLNFVLMILRSVWSFQVAVFQRHRALLVLFCLRHGVHIRASCSLPLFNCLSFLMKPASAPALIELRPSFRLCY